MFRAGHLVVDRVSRPMLHVPRAAVSIVGTIQPGVLRRALGQEHLEDGLAARILFSMPPKQKRVWTERRVEPALESAAATVVNQLYSLDFDPAHPDEQRPVVLPLSAKGKKAWISFFNEHNEEAEK